MNKSSWLYHNTISEIQYSTNQELYNAFQLQIKMILIEKNHEYDR